MGLLLIFLFGAMAISFLCSLLESTLLSTPISYLSMKEEEGDRNAILFSKLKANTVGAAGVGQQAAELFGSQWFGLVSALMTILILVFSEIIPKTIGSYHWKSLTWLSRIMKGLMVILYPIVWLVEKLRKRIAGDEPDTGISREEVSAMANMGEEEGVIDNSENKVIQNIMKLDDIKAYDVMTPRVVAAIAPENMTLKQFYKQEELSHNSRIPVYADSPEFITGYILRYDVLENLAEDKFDTRLRSIKRKIAAFHEETSVSDIWESLLKSKDQIALIIDDYGCFQGIITLEDIIETILGMEIIDENDTITDMQQYAKERWLKRKNQYVTPGTYHETDRRHRSRCRRLFLHRRTQAAAAGFPCRCLRGWSQTPRQGRHHRRRTLQPHELFRRYPEPRRGLSAGRPADEAAPEAVLPGRYLALVRVRRRSARPSGRPLRLPAIPGRHGYRPSPSPSHGGCESDAAYADTYRHARLDRASPC